MRDWPRMQFRFYGISKWSGKLIGDATEMQDFYKWAESRGIDIDGVHPYGPRPVPLVVEQNYPHANCYMDQEKADNFFS